MQADQPKPDRYTVYPDLPSAALANDPLGGALPAQPQPDDDYWKHHTCTMLCSHMRPETPQPQPAEAGEMLAVTRQRLDRVLSEFKAGKLEQGYTISLLLDKVQPLIEAEIASRLRTVLDELEAEGLAVIGALEPDIGEFRSALRGGKPTTIGIRNKLRQKQRTKWRSLLAKKRGEQL